MPQRDTAGVTHKTRTEIGSYLSRFCDGFSDARLGEFLGLSAGRILLKASRLGGDWRSGTTDDQIRHITDWLKSSIINDDAWLSNVDARGRPKKLMKFASIDQITQEADKAMLKAAQRLSGVKLVEGDEELYAELDDGYYVVDLLTPAALDRESAQMQHCIGDGAYDRRLYDDRYFYLSLRDAAGRPHVTMEGQGDRLIQIQGKQNEPPLKKYIDRLIPFIRKQTLSVVELPVRVLQHVIDSRGGWHPIDDLPGGLAVSGSLDFEGADITRLPDGMSVGENLILRRTGITVLPKGLSVRGNLCLDDTGITALPEDLSVGRSLFLEGAAVLKSLPKGLSVGRDIILRNTKIRTLPEDTYVGGNLLLSGSEVTSLPEGLVVRGNLDLSDSKITDLPKGLSVKGDLSLRNTNITSLPAGLSVKGQLILSQSNITCLSDIVLKCSCIFLEDTGDIVLPENLSLRGDLYLRRSSIASLPRGLSVGGILDLTSTNISTIPDDISVGRNLLLGGTAVTSLPEGLSIRGSLSLRGLRIEKLPDDLSVGGYLDIRGTLITSIPKGVSVGGKVLSDDPLLETPPNMTCG